MVEDKTAQISVPGTDAIYSLEERANKIRSEALLPVVSQARYEEAYRKFLDWKSKLFTSNVPDENMLLVYLNQLSLSMAPSSLWTIFSMLKRQFLVIHFFFSFFIFNFLIFFSIFLNFLIFFNFAYFFFIFPIFYIL